MQIRANRAQTTLPLMTLALWGEMAEATTYRYLATLTGVADPKAGAEFDGRYDDSGGPFIGQLEFTFTYHDLDNLQSLRATNDDNDGFISNFMPAGDPPVFQPDPDEEQNGSMERTTIAWYSTDHQLAVAGKMRLRAATLTVNEIGGPAGSDNGRVLVCESIDGTGGNDTLTGGAASECIDGGEGADVMKGGAGNDLYFADNPGDTVQENANNGTDTVRSSVTFTLPNNVENLILTGTGVINGFGNALGNQITGNGAKNKLDGKGGADTMTGGNGGDSYIVNDPGDVVVEGPGTGADIVQSSVSFTLPANVENLRLTGSNNVNGTGNALVNRMFPNDGNNVIDGGAGRDLVAYNYATSGVTVSLAIAGAQATLGSGSDTLVSIENLTGTAFVDNLTGNNGANVLNGIAGNDTLNGKLGNDTIFGGDDKDNIVFDTAPGPTNLDQIRDFVPADDTMRLENAVFTALTGTGALATTAFRVGTAATTAAHRIIYDPATGDVFYDADGTGGTAQVQFARLTTRPTLTSADFVVQ